MKKNTFRKQRSGDIISLFNSGIYIFEQKHFVQKWVAHLGICILKVVVVYVTIDCLERISPEWQFRFTDEIVYLSYSMKGIRDMAFIRVEILSVCLSANEW